MRARNRRTCGELGSLLVALLGWGCVITHESETARDSTPAASTSATAAADSIVPQSAPAPPVTPATPLPAASSTTPLTMDTVEVPDSGKVVPTPADLALLSAEMIMPLPNVKGDELRDTFNEPRGGGTRTHQALDIMAPRGTPVLSATPGRVLKLHTSKAGGLMVYAADSAERFVLMYAHLDQYAPEMTDGLPLQRGQVIGYVGTTGNAPPNAPHLHFAIAAPRDVDLWWTGTPVDPRPLLQHHGGAR